MPYSRDERAADGTLSVGDPTERPATAAAACKDVRYVEALDGELDDLAVVVALSLGEDAATADVAIEAVARRAGDAAVYASSRNLYLTQTERARAGDAYSYRTVILKFALDGAAVAFERSFAAPGRLLNQFSLSEAADGSLRVATTSRSPDGGWADTANNIFVFDAEGARIGALAGLAPGEEITGCRFTETRAYLVTFVRTDPLFVISVDDPTNPYVLGELKIPGYSAYLHPINATHVIGVGRDADEATGVERGLQLSLFDVSDELAPRRVAVEIRGDRGSSSEALDDHRAFQFWAAGDLAGDGVDATRGLLAMPAELASLARAADLYDDDRRTTDERAAGASYFQGLLLYDEGLRRVGNVTHHDAAFFDRNAPDGEDAWRYDFRDSLGSGDRVARSLRRGGALFTFSDNTVRKTTLDGRETLGEADLARDFEPAAGDA